MLELLATKHEDWIRIAFSLTNNMDKAKDLVQDMYVRLHRLGKTKEDISYKDTVNRYFVWTVLVNMYKVSMRKKVYKKLDTCELLGNEDVSDEDYNLDDDKSFEYIMNKIRTIVSSWKPTDRQLFFLYFMEGYSLREIAKGSGVGLSFIHNNIKRIRAIIREELSEDMVDYFNQDFDKII